EADYLEQLTPTTVATQLKRGNGTGQYEEAGKPASHIVLTLSSLLIFCDLR
ncbi:hypothetical protein CEXT_328861, partial [Caerostris extrusa]